MRVRGSSDTWQGRARSKSASSRVYLKQLVDRTSEFIRYQPWPLEPFHPDF